MNLVCAAAASVLLARLQTHLHTSYRRLRSSASLRPRAWILCIYTDSIVSRQRCDDDDDDGYAVPGGVGPVGARSIDHNETNVAAPLFIDEFDARSVFAW